MLDTDQLWNILKLNTALSATRIANLDDLIKSMLGSAKDSQNINHEYSSDLVNESSDESLEDEAELAGMFRQEESEDDVEEEDEEVKRFLEKRWIYEERTENEMGNQPEGNHFNADNVINESDSELDDEFFKASNMEKFADFLEEEQMEQERLQQLYNEERRRNTSENTNFLGDAHQEGDEEAEQEDSELESLADEFNESGSENDKEDYMYEDFFGREAKIKTKE